MAPALMGCWIGGGAGNFLFSVFPGGAVRPRGRSRPAPGVVDLRRGYSLSLARSDLRRAERHLPAAAIPVLAEVMELGRWGDERHRQGRGLADRRRGGAER